MVMKWIAGQDRGRRVLAGLTCAMLVVPACASGPETTEDQPAETALRSDAERMDAMQAELARLRDVEIKLARLGDRCEREGVVLEPTPATASVEPPQASTAPPITGLVDASSRRADAATDYLGEPAPAPTPMAVAIPSDPEPTRAAPADLDMASAVATATSAAATAPGATSPPSPVASRAALPCPAGAGFHEAATEDHSLRRWCELKGRRHGPYEVVAGQTVLMRGSFNRGKRQGSWRVWDPSGRLVSAGAYDNDVRVGPWLELVAFEPVSGAQLRTSDAWEETRVVVTLPTADPLEPLPDTLTDFSPRGTGLVRELPTHTTYVVEARGAYDDGRRSGRWAAELPGPSGTPIRLEVSYDKKGRSHGGVLMSWQGADGVPSTLFWGRYHHGKPDGAWRQESPLANTVSIMEFERGKPVGKWALTTGEVSHIVSFKRGLPHGLATELVGDSWVRTALDMERGKRHGDLLIRHNADLEALRGRFERDVAVGQWEGWNTQGDKILAADHDTGEHQEWRNGQLLAEGTLADGVRTGKWRFYRDNRVVEQGSYVDGKRHGLWREESESEGTLEGTYAHGKRQGPWYGCDGPWCGTIHYTAGVRDGAFDQTSGSQRRVGRYDNGNIDGELTYYERTQIVAKGLVQNGRRVGQWSRWWPTGQRRDVMDCDAGGPGECVPVEAWHPDGTRQLSAAAPATPAPKPAIANVAAVVAAPAAAAPTVARPAVAAAAVSPRPATSPRPVATVVHTPSATPVVQPKAVAAPAVAAPAVAAPAVAAPAVAASAVAAPAVAAPAAPAAPATPIYTAIPAPPKAPGDLEVVSKVDPRGVLYYRAEVDAEGNLCGRFYKVDPKGVATHGQFRRGTDDVCKKDGVWRWVRPQGAPLREERYANGVPTGTWSRYDARGVVVESRSYGPAGTRVQR